MANPELVDVDRWVTDRMAALTPSNEWKPSAANQLVEATARRHSRHALRRRWTTAAAAATVLFIAIPTTRAFGARCIETCVSLTTRVSQLWRADEPEAGKPRVVGATLGDLAPDLLGTDAQGVAVHLSSLRGQVVILNFWATWCG